MADPRTMEQFNRLADMVVQDNRMADMGMPNYMAEMAEAQRYAPQGGAPGPVYQASGAHMLMPGMREANEEYNMQPVLTQTDPYATAAVRVFPFGDQMAVQNLVAYPSRFPHVLRGYGEDFTTRVAPYMVGVIPPWATWGPPPLPPVPRGGYGGGGGVRASANAGAAAPTVKQETPAKPTGVDLQPILDLVNGIVPPAVDLGPNVRFGELNPVPPKAPVEPRQLMYAFADDPVFAAQTSGEPTAFDWDALAQGITRFGNRMVTPAEGAELLPQAPAPTPTPAYDWSEVIDAANAFTPQGPTASEVIDPALNAAAQAVPDLPRSALPAPVPTGVDTFATPDGTPGYNMVPIAWDGTPLLQNGTGQVYNEPQTPQQMTPGGAERDAAYADAVRAFLNYYIPYEAMIRAGKATAREIRNRGKKRRK